MFAFVLNLATSTCGFARLSLRRSCLQTAPAAAQGPCDIYNNAGTPCVAAHSMTRALYGNYNGALYQVLRVADNQTVDVGVMAAGGVANAATQDAFCGTQACVVQRIYDQSPMANHLDIGPGGGAVPRGDKPVNATRHKVRRALAVALGLLAVTLAWLAPASAPAAFPSMCPRLVPSSPLVAGDAGRQ